MDIFKSGPNYTKLKTNLRLIVNRLKLLEKKRTELAQKARIEIADYIRAGKIERAKIRVEHIVREDYMVESMEMIEMYADLLLARFGLIETMKELDEGLEECISSIIWASPRLSAEVPEFTQVTKELTAKYGPEFALASKNNANEKVNFKLIKKMSIHQPEPALIEKYMVVIAETYRVPYQPDKELLSQSDLEMLGSVPAPPNPSDMYDSQPPPPPTYNPSGPIRPINHQSHQPPPPPGGQAPFTGGYSAPPPASSTQPGPPPDIGFTLPDVPALPRAPDNRPGPGPPPSDPNNVNFDDLEARFNKLKKK